MLAGLVESSGLTAVVELGVVSIIEFGDGSDDVSSIFIDGGMIRRLLWINLLLEDSPKRIIIVARNWLYIFDWAVNKIFIFLGFICTLIEYFLSDSLFYLCRIIAKICKISDGADEYYQ